MRTRRRVVVAIAGAAVAVAAAGTFAPNGMAATSAVAVVCSAPAWAEGDTYAAGQQVTYQGHLYQALVAHTAWPGTGWNPAATPSLWTDLGACTGGSTPPPTTAPTSRPPTTPPTTAP